MRSQYAELEWREGDVPVSKRFDDPYFSLAGGLAETEHVFLVGNELPSRFRPAFHIAELGFGTGLNLLAALRSWRLSGQTGKLYFTSFEAFPMHPEEMMRAQAVFPELKEIAAELAPYWMAGAKQVDLHDLVLQLIVGDARKTMPEWSGEADAWFLDGFSPAKNPELWGSDMMHAVAKHTASYGTAATYTAAGFVRRNLEAAGFSVERHKGYGRKRHMTMARIAAA